MTCLPDSIRDVHDLCAGQSRAPADSRQDLRVHLADESDEAAHVYDTVSHRLAGTGRLST